MWAMLTSVPPDAGPSEVFLNEFSVCRRDHKRLSLHSGDAHEFL